MEDKFKISIIIPVYNSEKYLDKLLESIISQTYKNYEIILIDDGSTDNSLQKIKSYEKENNFIKYLSIKNSGPGVARKKGFEISTGDILIFVDSDDFIPNKKVFQRIIEIYEKEKFDILLFNVKVIKNGQEIIASPFMNKKIKTGKINVKYLTKNRIAPALWYKVFVKEKMKNEYFCNYKNFEDFYTTYLYLNECKNFYYTDEVFYYSNRDNENSISKKRNADTLSKTVDLLKETYDKCKNEYKFIISKTMTVFYIDLRRLIQVSNDTIEEKRKRIKKAKELKEYFNVWDVIKMRISVKEYIKYFYYEIIDKII